jgi:hypothetical protein
MKHIEMVESHSSQVIVEQLYTLQEMMGSSKSRILSKDMISMERLVRKDPLLKLVQDRMIQKQTMEDWTLNLVNCNHFGEIMIF